MSLAAGGRGLGAAWSPTHVQVTVLQARGLRAKGPGGTSDAYALIQVGKEKYATSVSERSLGAPVWREEATFELPPLGLPAGPGAAAAATLQLTVLHRALLGLDKFLGRAEVDLRELHRDQGRRKTQWYTLKSKPGKKEKERGEIEVDIQFMRNNMTASMFDLSMKDKSRNPFGKLKDKIKGKRHEGHSDTASAIIPSSMNTGDSDDDSPTKDKKKKSKIKTLFSRSGLQKTPLSQSMSVLPIAKPEKLTLRPEDFQSQWEDDMEDESSSPSKNMSHRRTASADKPLNQMNFNLPKKEGLSFFGGLRSKNDQLSRSNVCINGNHVYLEQPEPKNEAVPKESTPSSSPSPQGFRKKHLFSSTENLSSRPSKESGESGRMSPDHRLSGSLPKDSFKSLTLPSYKPVIISGDRNVASVNVEIEKEIKENKKQENKKSSLLSLVTGKKDTPKSSESESSTPSILVKEKEITPMEATVKEKEAGLVEIPVKDLDEKPEEDSTAPVSRQSISPNSAEEVPRKQLGAEPKPGPEPDPRPPALSARGPQTKAVKPRMGVSPEAQPKAKLSSSLFFSGTTSGSCLDPLHSKLGQESKTESTETLSVPSSFSPPTIEPVSTSTPTGNWPFSDESQANSEGPSFFLSVKSQKEGLIQVSNTSSGSPELLGKQSLLHEGNGISVEESGEIAVGKNKGSREFSRPSWKIQENMKDKHFTKEQKENVPTFSQVSPPESLPSSKDPQQTRTLTQDKIGAIRHPSGKPWLKGSKEASSCGSSLEDKVNDSGVVSANEGAEPPNKMEDLATSFDFTVDKSNLTGLYEKDDHKKTKKRVSFSEDLFPEEGIEKAISFIEEKKNRPPELKSKGESDYMLSDRETLDIFPPEEIKKEMITTEQKGSPKSGARAIFGPNHAQPASPTDHSLSSALPVRSALMSGSHFSEDLVSESISEKATSSFRIERYENYSENYQSKASDHEGLLSDPLRSLDLVSDLRSPVMGDLNLSLPSIPEVTSDDERVDQLEDTRTTLATPSKEENWSPSMEETLEARGSTLFQEEENVFQVEKPGVFNSSMFSSKHTTAPDDSKLHSGECLDLDKEIPVPKSLERQELREEDNHTEESKNQRSSFQDSPVSSHSLSETFSATHSFPGSPHSDTYHTNRAESPQKTSAESSTDKVENSDKRKQLLRVWVSPSETQSFPAQPSGGTAVSAKHRTHPVKPMNTSSTKALSTSLGTATIISENLLNEAITKKYKPSDPEFAYTQLTRDELIQLVLKQKETIHKKEFQVRELEDYIDNLLVRVMEETPNILRSPAQLGSKAGKI